MIILTQPKIGRTLIRVEKITHFYEWQGLIVIYFESGDFIQVQESLGYIENEIRRELHKSEW